MRKNLSKREVSRAEKRVRNLRTETPGRSPKSVLASITGVLALILMGVVPSAAAAAPAELAPSKTLPGLSATGAAAFQAKLQAAVENPANLTELTSSPASQSELPQSGEIASEATPEATQQARLARALLTPPEEVVPPAGSSVDGSTSGAGGGSPGDASTPPESGTDQSNPGADTGKPDGEARSDDDQTPPDQSGDGQDPGAPDLDTPQSAEEPQSGEGAQSGAQIQSRVGLLAVGDATVTVTARTFGTIGSVSIPQIPSSTANTVGAVYELYTAPNTVPRTLGVATGLTCEITSASPGSCVIEVPAAQANQQYFVVQTQAAIGTYFSSLLNLGNSTTPDRNTNYPGLTPNLSDNKAVNMPQDVENQFGNGESISTSFGAAVNSLNNPVLQARCAAGVNIAVVLDVSGSMDTGVGGGATRLDLLKDTFNDPTTGVFATLQDKASKIALFNFSTNSPGNGNSFGWNQPTPVAVTAGNIQSLKNKIDGLSAAGFTNWDQALKGVANANSNQSAANKYDVVIFVTDGAPNYVAGNNGSGGTAPDGSNVTLRSLEAAIYSANAIKDQGVRLIGYGIAQGDTGADQARQNLRAVSGPTASSDYFVAQAQELMEYLQSLFGSLTCDVPITVEKYVPGATAGSWTPKQDWNMNVTQAQGSAGSFVPPASTTTDANGKAGPWTLSFTENTQRGSVLVSETQQDGWQTAAPAQYEIYNLIEGGDPVTGELPDGGALNDLKAGDRVTVKFYNEEVTNPSIAKDFTSVVSAGEGKFKVNYLVSVTGANRATTYDVGDVPAFAPGVTLVSGSAHQIDNPGDHNDIGPIYPIPDGGGKFREGVALGANETHYYHVEWIVTVDNNEVAGHETCTGEPGEGYFNTAQLYVGGQEIDQDDACGPVTKSVVPLLAKTAKAGTPTQNPDGTWTVDYTVTVTLPTSPLDNPEELDSSYSLVDTLDFGPGVNVESASWTGPSGSSGTFVGTTGTLATDRVIFFTAPVHTYDVTVNASIDPTQIEPGQTDACLPVGTDGGSGFLNLAKLTSAGVERNADACVPPVINAPTVEKTASTSVKNADGTWKISYNVTVTNSSSAALNYTLSDTAEGTPTGASWAPGSSWSKSGPVVTGTGTATISSTWNGSGTLATGNIGADSKHVFTVSRDVALEPDGAWDHLHCEPGDKTTGFWNSATVTNGVTTSGPVEACAQILAPRINVEKTVASVTQTSVDSWSVVYDVIVTNTGNMPGSFGLNDVPNFGEGFTVTSEGWLGDPSTHPGSGPSSTYILNGQTLNYQYGVAASFDPATPDPGLLCEASPSEAGAFMNQVLLDSDSGQDSDFACAEPDKPVVLKDTISAVQDATTGNWTVTYQISVTAPEAGDSKLTALAYSLSDTAEALPTGVTRVGNWTLSGPSDLAGGTFTPAAPAWNGSGQIGTGTLPMGATHTFTVSQVLSVGSTASAADLECRPDSDSGIWNEATVTNGIGGNSSADCASLKAPAWSIEKTSAPTTGSTVAPGDTIDYTIKVSNDSEAVVTGITITDDISGWIDNAALSANPSGGVEDTDAETLKWSIASLGVGDSVELKYSVLVNSDAFGVTLKNVVTGTAVVPPTECGPGDTSCSTTHETDPKWTVAKSSDPASGTTVAPGDTLTYTLSVTSLSKDKAVTGVKVTDDLTGVLAYADLDEGGLPAGVTFDAGTKTLTWLVGSLTAGETRTVDYNVTVKSDAYGVTLKNLATGEGSVPPERCLPGTQECSTTHDTDPAWSLTKSSVPASGSVVLPGEKIEYTLTVASLSKVKTQNGLFVVDDLTEVVANAVLDTSSLPAEATFDPATSQLTWNFDALAAGATKTLTYSVTVNEDALGVTLKNVVAEGTEVPPPVDCPVADVDCRSTEHYTPKWSLVKSSVPVSGSVVAPGDTITYTLEVTNSADIELVGAKAIDDLAGVLGNATLVKPLAEGLSEDGQTLIWDIPTVGAGDTVKVSYQVKVNANAIGVTLKNVVTPGGDVPPPVDCPAEDPDCRTTEHFTPELDVEKSVVAANQNADGTWTVKYDVLVTNLAGVATTYTLTDELEFGDGINVNSAKWTGETSGDFVGNTGALATDHPIAAGSTIHTYQVEVNASVEPEAWESPAADLTCPTREEENGKGGFLNVAELGYPGSTDQSEDCAEPGRPTVAKDFVSATQGDDPDTWAVVYDINVEGIETWPTVYDLKDIPGFAEGVELEGGTWQRTDLDPVTEPVAIGAEGQIVSAAELPAGAKHTYRVVWSVKIPAGVAPEVAECTVPGTPGNGFFNEAVLTSGGNEQVDDACGPIDETVRPAVAKAVTAVSQAADGTWDVTYDVTVTLPTDEASNPKKLSAKYDLVDNLRFGAGIEVNSATWSGGPGGVVDQAFVDGSATLATAQEITPEDSVHTYSVKVNAKVTLAAFEGGTAFCNPEDTAGSGFLNRVTLTSAGTPSEAEACGQPDSPTWTLEKSSDPVSGSKVKPGESVTYTLKVTNVGKVALFDAVVKDDLADVLKHTTLTQPLAEGLILEGSTLTWTVPSVKAGESVSVSYSVTVKKGVADVKFKNQATPASFGGECLPNKCSTEHLVPPTPVPPKPGPGTLPKTGAVIGSVVLGAGLLTGLGWLLVRRSRRDV